MWTYHISRVPIEYVIFSLIREYSILITRVYILDLGACLYKGLLCTLVNDLRENNKIDSSLIFIFLSLFISLFYIVRDFSGIFSATRFVF